MPKIVDKPERGIEEINIFRNKTGLCGPHWTLWGLEWCLHIYEDECMLSKDELLDLAASLENK